VQLDQRQKIGQKVAPKESVLSKKRYREGEEGANVAFRRGTRMPDHQREDNTTERISNTRAKINEKSFRGGEEDEL